MSDEIKTLIEDQGRAFEEFKAANDKRVELLEKKDHVPADLKEKIERIDSDLNTKFRALQDELADAKRPKLGEQKGLTAEQIEHKEALASYLRTGKGEDNVRALEAKALSGRSDPDGGLLVDPVTDAAIDRVAEDETSFSGLASTVTIGTDTYKKMVKTRGVAGQWNGQESEGLGETNAPQWAEIKIETKLVEAEPWSPNSLLEDADYDLESDILQEIGITFNELEGEAFLTGDGVLEPKGLLSYTTVANASYAWGSVGYVASGADGDFAASNPADKIIDLQHALKTRYRAGAVMLMSDDSLSKVRQMKDGSGNFYLFNPQATAGFAGSVLGSPVVLDDYMPTIASDSYSIAYGNFARAYKIVRRRGIAMIVDRYTKKGFTKHYTTRRTGGGIVNYEAFKVMKFAAT